MCMMSLASRTLLAILLLPGVVAVVPAPVALAQATAGETVNVPIANGDSATVTGMLAIRHRGARQFLVIESPTPYRLINDLQSGSAAGKIIRDIPIHIPGHDAELTGFSGRTVTATGHLRFAPAATSWNGALLESNLVILPGGQELRAAKH